MIRILLADDDKDDNEIFAEALKGVERKTHVFLVNNGVELTNALKNYDIPQPDFLFLDLHMPQKSGFECLQNLKDAAYKGLTIVVLTTSAHPRDIEAAYEMGADYFLSKPSTMREYIDALNKLFSKGPGIRPSREDFVLNTQGMEHTK